MAYFSELMDHIAKFLKAMLDRFLEVLGLIDLTTQALEDASETQASVADAQG